MKISTRTIEAIRLIHNGDSDKPETAAPYRRAVDIEEFFKEYGVEHIAGSRWFVTENYLRQINNSPAMKSAIEKTLHPTNYLDTDFNLKSNIEYLNRFLEYDGYKIELHGKIPKVREVKPQIPLDEVSLPELLSDDLTDWLNEHSRKCQSKIAENDYAGAITNARSMVEELYIWILKNTEDGYNNKDEGDLVKLGNTAMKRFGMDPKHLDTSLKQLISGMHSMIAGLAGLRNKASDAHGTNYRPSERHAVLAVSAAHTAVNYFIALCRDKSITDQEALEAYYEAIADFHAR